MHWTDDVLFIIGGILAGIVNTLSGSGSLFSIGVMVWSGIPMVAANIASRPGVLLQNITGILVLRKYYKLNIKDIPVKPALICCLGAMLGAVCANRVSSSNFNFIASAVMLILLIQYLFPNRLFKPFRLKAFKKSGAVGLLLFFLTGFYGGFIQIGIGILVLTLLLDVLKMPYAQSNAYKLAIILVYTIPTTIYFALSDAILWRPALFLAAGQVLGAYLAALFIGKNKSAANVAKNITIIMIVVTLMKVWLF
ncbi:MAG: sulfite exporter TauE/SafE family protein [Roseivirga sp.]